MKNIIYLFGAIFILNACTLTSPSMLSSEPMQLSKTTMMEQVRFSDLNDNVLSALAHHYTKYGASTLDLTMTYDPSATDFTAAEAAHQLRHVKQNLAKKGVTNVSTQTQAIPNGTASLLVSYDMVQALAPLGCQAMPGLYREGTTRFIGDYKFGCSVDMMVANQIAHPADLQGTSILGDASGRRQAAVLEGHLKGDAKPPLAGIERDDLQSQ